LKIKDFYQVVLGGIKSYCLQKTISWVRVGGWGKKGGIPFISLVFFCHNMMIYQRDFPIKYFS
jgi:hypothetical protein